MLDLSRSCSENMLADWLFAQECRFLRGVPAFGQLPDLKGVEFCFAGRSNVGKSSLINALVNRKKLVRASSWPGRTQEINFFTLSDTIIFVDLPGYGYTRAPKGVSHNWQKGVHHYLKGSKNLTRVFLLLDSRRGARKSDMEMMAMLAELCISFQLVLTKSDKISATEQTELLDDLMMLIAKDFSTACPEIIATSTRGLRGIDQLRRGILPFIRRETFPDRLHKAFDNIRVYNPVSSTRII